jgi:hypothetical protein
MTKKILVRQRNLEIRKKMIRQMMRAKMKR